MPSTMISRIDGLTTSVAVKAPIKIMTSSPITLFGEQTITAVAPDGTVISSVVVDGDRVGVNGQADQTTNGIYVVRSTSWKRALDFDGALDAVFGTMVFDSIPLIWRLTTPPPVLFGTSNIKFEAELDFRDSPISADLTLRVPSEYPTLQSAIERAAVIRTKHQVRVYILIESGHVPASGFKVVDKDLSFVTINSEDAVVTVSPSFSHVSNTDLDLDQVVARTDKIGFLAVRSKMPVWNILVDFSACPTVYGYVLNAGSYGYVRSNKGVKNTSHVALTAGTNIVVAGNSSIDAFHAVASGGLISGITVTHRSNANVAEIDASGTTGIGLDVSRGSMVYANLSVVSGRPFGIDGRRSFIAAQGVTFANCSSAAIRGSIGATIVAVDAVITGSAPSFNYIMPEQGCNISVSNATVNGSAITDAHVYQAAGINKLTGRGVVTSQSTQDAHPTFLKSGSASRQVSGSPSVTALSYATAFTRAEPGYFAGGVVFGDDVGFRLTCDGAVVIEDVTRVIGGSAKSVAYVPPFSFLASCTLEVYNRGGVTANVAYRLTEYR